MHICVCQNGLTPTLSAFTPVPTNGIGPLEPAPGPAGATQDRPNADMNQESVAYDIVFLHANGSWLMAGIVPNVQYNGCWLVEWLRLAAVGQYNSYG